MVTTQLGTRRRRTRGRVAQLLSTETHQTRNAWRPRVAVEPWAMCGTRAGHVRRSRFNHRAEFLAARRDRFKLRPRPRSFRALAPIAGSCQDRTSERKLTLVRSNNPEGQDSH